MERRLGLGLGALLPDSSTPEEGPSELGLDEIRPNPHQPRKTFDAESLDELRQSIQNHGVLQPVVVRSAPAGFELISGERRVRAARLAGLRTIPAVVRHDVGDEAMLELALVENVQRKDLDPLERARGYREMMTALDLTQDQVAQRVGLKRSTVANHIRLLELPETVQQAVAQGSLSMGHARALLAVQDRERLLVMASDAVERRLSVRDVEALVREQSDPPGRGSREGGSKPSPRSSKTTAARPPWLLDLEGKLRERYGAKVEIRNGSDFAGQISIHYAERDDLERLLGLLLPTDSV